MIKKILAILTIGLFLFGFISPVFATQIIFYPDPDPEISSVDGIVARKDIVDETWGIIRAGIGTYKDDSVSLNFNVKTYSSNVIDKYDYLSRGIILFDTSNLPDNIVIENAIISLWGTNKYLDMGEPNLSLVSSSPASNTELIISDFQSALGSIRFADDIIYADFVENGYNNFTLNVNGINAINKIGISKFGLRLNWDLDNILPTTWGNYSQSGFVLSSAESINKPKLTINFSYETKLFNLPVGFISGTLAYIGNLFTDINPIILIVMGLPLGFWAIWKIMMLAIPKEERAKKSKEFHRTSEKLEKQDKRALKSWERKLKNEEKRELRQLKETQKGDWF